MPTGMKVVARQMDTGEYVVNNSDEVIVFHSEEDALEFFTFLGYPAEYINNLQFVTYKDDEMKKLEEMLIQSVQNVFKGHVPKPFSFRINIYDKKSVIDEILFYDEDDIGIDVGDEVYEVVYKAVEKILIPFTDVSIQYFQGRNLMF